MSGAGRRGEAHLWLLIEESLVAIVRGGGDPWEVRRNFRYVADAVAAAGVVPAVVASSVVAELDDVLAVRGLVPIGSFSARPVDGPAGAAPDAAPVGTADVWLEAEVERHLDLLAGVDPAAFPGAGAEAMRILGGPLRALEAARALTEAGRAVVSDLAVSLASAGFMPGRSLTGEGRPRHEWVRFLRGRPAPVPEPHEPDEVRSMRVPLGAVGGRTVRVDEVAWSPLAVELRLSLRPVGGFRHVRLTPMLVRVEDEGGALHLGQAASHRAAGGWTASVALRPGLAPAVRRLDVRVTCGGERIEGALRW